MEQSRIQSPQTRREQLNAQLLAYFVSLNEKAQKGTFEKRLRAKGRKGSVVRDLNDTENVSIKFKKIQWLVKVAENSPILILTNIYFNNWGTQILCFI